MTPLPCKCNSDLNENCTGLAMSLHDAYHAGRYRDDPGRYPSFWRAFGDDRRSLQRMFSFFCSLNPENPNNELDESGREQYSAVIRLLINRLIARREFRLPDLVAQDLEPVIRQMSKTQVQRFNWLDDLIQPAMDAFAAGQLANLLAPKDLERNLEAERLKPHSALGASYPQPNGAFFFCWSEFAFAALELDLDQAIWLRIMPCLLRAQYIYIRAFSRAAARRDTSWNFDSFKPANYLTPIDPRLVIGYSFDHHRDIPSLSGVATRCLCEAFPNGIDYQRALTAVLVQANAL